MLKKLLFLITLIVFTNLIYLVAEIIPLKKPTQSNRGKEQKLLIDVLKPLPNLKLKK